MTLRRLKLNIFPYLGQRPIHEVTAPELLSALRRIEDRGALEVARRVRGICSMIFRYAVASGLAERDPAADLRGAIAPPVKRHFATITDPKAVGQLLRDIDQCKASYPIYCALRIAPFVFVRPGELRNAEWSEFDFKNKEWRIPAEKMKMRSLHIVPLARQVITILEDLRPLTGGGKYLFPSIRTTARPMSENTINVALRRIGYAKEDFTGHGFRAMASTLLNEQGWNRDAKENESQSWLPMQSWLLDLRRRGMAVLLVHHAGKSGDQRGTSAREDIMNTVISLRRPRMYTMAEGAWFQVHLTKVRGIVGEEAQPFEVHLRAEGNARGSSTISAAHCAPSHDWSTRQ